MAIFSPASTSSGTSSLLIFASSRLLIAFWNASRSPVSLLIIRAGISPGTRSW